MRLLSRMAWMTAEPSLPVALVRASLPIVSVFGGLPCKLRVLVVLLCCAVLCLDTLLMLINVRPKSVR